jgi:hypothetical protein
MMKLEIYSALIGCSMVAALFATGDHLPVGYLLMPGFFIGCCLMAAFRIASCPS